MPLFLLPYLPSRWEVWAAVGLALAGLGAARWRRHVRLGPVVVRLGSGALIPLLGAVAAVAALFALRMAVFWWMIGFTPWWAMAAGTAFCTLVAFVGGAALLSPPTLREKGLTTGLGGAYPWARVEGFRETPRGTLFVGLRLWGRLPWRCELRCKTREDLARVRERLAAQGVREGLRL